MATPSDVMIDPFSLVSYPPDFLARYIRLLVEQPAMVHALSERPGFNMVGVPVPMARGLGQTGLSALSANVDEGNSMRMGLDPLDMLTQPTRVTTRPLSNLENRFVACNYKKLASVTREFGKALESGSDAAFTGILAKNFENRDGASIEIFLQNVKALIGSSRTRRVIFTESSNIEVLGETISADISGSIELDEKASSFKANVVFELEDKEWKIAAFDLL